MCPPVNTTHLVDDYPNYYDPLYFPHLHPSVFENSFNFCNWLASALNSHKLMCHHCPIFEDVCVFYDGMIVSIACNARSVTMSLQALQNAGYHHCIVLCKIAKRDPLSVFQHLSTRITDLPSWFLFSPKLVKQQLMSMTMDDLSTTGTFSISRKL